MATSRPSMCERKTASCSVTSMQMGQAEQLEAAAIGQDRSVPTHEAVQSAQGGDDFFARPQREMVGIAQDHFRPGGADLFDLQSLDAGLCGHGHEGRQLHVAVRRGENRTAGCTMGVGVQKLELESHHVCISSTTSATTLRIPRRAASGDVASQLKLGNSAHSPTCSRSSSRPRYAKRIAVDFFAFAVHHQASFRLT